MIWNSRTLSLALGINLDCDINSTELQFNSKDVKKDDLFIALKGKADGHDYVAHAIEAGASAVIISQDVKGVPKNKIIKVQDCSRALLSLAKYKRKNSKAKFIGITGSVGKTSTKEALKLMLASTLRNNAVYASRGNFNNYLGLQINLASMPCDAEYAVFELGMNRPGEISELSKLLKPDIAIITEISEAHIKFLGNLENIINAKCEIFDGLAPQGSIIIPKYDQKVYEQIKRSAELKNINRIYTFGHADSDAMLVNYKASNDSCSVLYGLKVNLEDEDNSYIPRNPEIGSQNKERGPEHTKVFEDRSFRDFGKPIFEVRGIFEEIGLDLPQIPKAHCLNFAACFLAIKALGLNTINAASSLSKYVLMYGRGEIKDITVHNKNFKIICDHYNASPASMKAALENFKSIPHSRKTLILGDMLELGDQSGTFHTTLIPYIIAAKALKIILVGEFMKEIASYLPKSTKVFCYNNTEELLVNLLQILTNDELILIKASKSIGFEKILDYFNKDKT